MKDCGPKALSDSRSKEEIRRLQSTNEALTQALDVAHAKTGEGLLPPTEYPRLPSHTNFADTPAANKVAAQNVGLQAAAAPAASPPPGPMAMQPNPQQANMARSANPAFNVGAAPPDLSALDEAYRRQGMGG